jgi:hypothetical protein
MIATLPVKEIPRKSGTLLIVFATIRNVPDRCPDITSCFLKTKLVMSPIAPIAPIARLIPD